MGLLLTTLAVGCGDDDGSGNNNNGNDNRPPECGHGLV
jgi:hypothetical protein